MPQIRLQNKAMMPYDVVAMIKGNEIPNYLTLGAFWPTPISRKISVPRSLYPIAQKAAGEAGGDYWVKRVVDNMFTEKWAQFIWPMIGMSKDAITTETAPEVGIRVAQLMSDPDIRNQLINKEQVAEEKEREAKKASVLKQVKIGAAAAGIFTGIVASGVMANAAKKAGSVVDKVSDETVPKVSDKVISEVKTSEPQSVSGELIQNVQDKVTEKVKEIVIQKVSEGMAPAVTEEIQDKTGEEVSVSQVEQELANKMREDQGLEPKKSFGIVEIGAGLGILAAIGRMAKLW